MAGQVGILDTALVAPALAFAPLRRFPSVRRRRGHGTMPGLTEAP